MQRLVGNQRREPRGVEVALGIFFLITSKTKIIYIPIITKKIEADVLLHSEEEMNFVHNNNDKKNW